MKIKKKNKNTLVILFFGLTTLSLSIQSFNFYFDINSFGGHEWYTAEWLINYSFGFIRRGMFGTLIINLPFSPEISLIFLTYLLHYLYVIYLLSLLLLFIRNTKNNLSSLLLFSPAFIFFHITNPEAIFRKEVLGLLALSIVALGYSFKYRNIFFLFGLFFYIVGIFSGEYNLLFYLPITYIIFKQKDNYLKSKIFALSISSFSYFFFYLKNLSKVDEIPRLICGSLYKFNYYESFCSGAIKFLGYDIKETLEITTDYYKTSQYEAYIFYLLVSIVPFLFTDFIKKNTVFFCIFSASFIPFFIISIDWGRIIYMYISSLTILFFLENNKKYNLKGKYQIGILLLFIFINMPYYEASVNGLINLNNINQKIVSLYNVNSFSYFIENYLQGLQDLFKATVNFLI